MSDWIENQSAAQRDAHTAIVNLYDQCFDDEVKQRTCDAGQVGAKLGDALSTLNKQYPGKQDEMLGVMRGNVETQMHNDYIHSVPPSDSTSLVRDIANEVKKLQK